VYLALEYAVTYCWPVVPGVVGFPLAERVCDDAAFAVSEPLETVGSDAEWEEAFLRMPLGLGWDADGGSGGRWAGSGIISTLIMLQYS